MVKLNRYLYPVLVGVLILSLIYGGWLFLSPSERKTSLGAAATSIERLAALSVIVEGTVMDEGKGVNLRRNSQDPTKESLTITPGTEYKVVVSKVIKGDVNPGDEIYVSILGGKYKGKSEPMRVNLQQANDYLFFISTAAQGEPYYYSPMSPNIFENQAGKLVPLANEKEFLEIFQDAEVTETEFYSRLQTAVQSQVE